MKLMGTRLSGYGGATLCHRRGRPVTLGETTIFRPGQSRCAPVGGKVVSGLRARMADPHPKRTLEEKLTQYGGNLPARRPWRLARTGAGTKLAGWEAMMMCGQPGMADPVGHGRGALPGRRGLRHRRRGTTPGRGRALVRHTDMERHESRGGA